ncbi:FprA family A-type flavoprotein [Geoglobus acetivorans]|uniref:Rubredoxin-oxygen oxidoreductase n=1 Tax=Geoglobus acetivorans TaxID=565033 RepID=A0A0A7GHW5_GEOAI|nr:rubredoxin-oxygen oxidoreductase [Geoglobus acetivorans]
MHVELKPGIYWVGAVDWNIRNFHGYTTRFGTTYNAYLIRAEKTVLVDTVKAGFENQLFEKLDALGVDNLDYLVVNHIEMDHAGSVKAVIERYPEVKIVTNVRGKNGLKEAYGIEHDTIVVKTGDKLEVGKTLTFIETPLVHWPDSMATYVVEDKVLLPNDAFGEHYSSARRFDDEFSDEEMGVIFRECAKYYANIVLLYSKQVSKVLESIESMGLEIDVIGPSHGIIWRKRIPEIVEKYRGWSSGEAEERVVVAYDSMWNHTEKAVKEVVSGIEEAGVDYILYRLSVSDFTEVMTDVMLSKGLIVGSPTLNRELFPSVASFLTYMKGLKPFNKVAGAFGSYGWSGEAVGKIVDIFNELKFDVVGSVRFKFSHDGAKDDLRELGRAVAERVKES